MNAPTSSKKYWAPPLLTPSLCIEKPWVKPITEGFEKQDPPPSGAFKTTTRETIFDPS